MRITLALRSNIPVLILVLSVTLGKLLSFGYVHCSMEVIPISWLGELNGLLNVEFWTQCLVCYAPSKY